MITPEPKATPASRVSSNVRGRSIDSGVTKLPAAPPRRTALRFPGPEKPPAASNISPRVAPNSNSYRPGRATLPLKQKSLVPED